MARQSGKRFQVALPCTAPEHLRTCVDLHPFTTRQHRGLPAAASKILPVPRPQLQSWSTRWPRAQRLVTWTCHRDAPAYHSQLANGLSMPTIHLGVYLTSGKETYQAVRWALEVSLLDFWSPNHPGRHVFTHAGWLSRVGRPPFSSCRIIDNRRRIQYRFRPNVP
jgi:hypothetical protein